MRVQLELAQEDLAREKSNVARLEATLRRKQDDLDYCDRLLDDVASHLRIIVQWLPMGDDARSMLTTRVGRRVFRR